MSGRIEDARAIVEDAEERLAPLSLATGISRGGTRRSPRPRRTPTGGRVRRSPGPTRSPTGSCSAPSSGHAQPGRTATSGRRLELLRNLMLTHQVPDALRARIVELESSVDMRFSRHRGVVARRRGRGHRDQAHPSPERRRRRSGAKRGKRRRRSAQRSPTTSASSRAFATRRLAASATVTGSRCRCPRTSSTRGSSSRPSARPTA